MNTSRSASRITTLLKALTLSTALLVSGGVFAHAHLVSATPAADSHVPSADRIELTFNEALTPRASRVTLSKVNADKSLTPVEHLKVELAGDNKVLRATPSHKLAPGSYKVEWRAVGGDNHPMTGDYQFMIH